MTGGTVPFPFFRLGVLGTGATGAESSSDAAVLTGGVPLAAVEIWTAGAGAVLPATWA